MASESRFFTVITTVETTDGKVTHAPLDYTAAQADNAIAKFHEECNYNRLAEHVAYYCVFIINEFGGVEMSESYRKQEATPAPSAE
jgi:hypothetical protein